MRRGILIGLATVAVLPALLSAQDRLVRTFTGESGPPTVVALAQDSAGFLWAGSRAGLFRYDGNRFERWSPEILPLAVGSIAVAPDGTVVVVDADGRIVELTRDGGHVLPGAARRSPDYSQIATFDAAGRLWIVTIAGDVAWRDAAGEWQSMAPDGFRGDTARKIFGGGAAGGTLVATGAGLWRALPGAPPHRMLDGYRIVDALVLRDGSIVALSSSGDVIRIDTGAPEIVIAAAALPPRRGISIAERDGMLWVATDRYLVALQPDGGAEALGARHGVAAGGPLLVDHEGSLWHAGFTALSHYPEPRTRVWSERHGLTSAHTRFLGRSGDALWVTTWQGVGFLQMRDGQWNAGPIPGWRARAQMCSDGAGGLFVGSDHGIQHLRGTRVTTVNARARIGFGMCSPAPGGGTWIATGAGPQFLSEDGSTIEPVRSFPVEAPDSSAQVILEDGTGRLWVGSGERICHASAAAARSDGGAHWTCEPLPAGIVHLNSIAELGSGTIWAASSTMGVLRRHAGRWQPLADNATLPTRSVLNLTPSPRGGVWLVGTGILARVEEQPDGAGWQVLERLGAWHGLPSVGGGDLLEEADGTIWIATAGGVVHVPAGVRSAEPLPPRMALVEARVDGRRIPLGGALVLPADRNRLELRFAALTFRDPGRVRYQVRLSPDEQWTGTEGQPFFNWVDLPAGQHRPQVRASLDGATWSVVPAELAFRVLPAWYRTGWALMLFALLAAALLFGLYRARLAYLLGLERQRTRIAMDLHDEMGSGLASIGILAGVLSNDVSESGEDDGIANEVARTAEELGTALSDIVWSLDPHSATLEELATRLAEHGGRLFADHVQFDTV
ncbi:MAG: hypothetical protein KFH98_02790, partial [Gemmatimonadetes bacterium]|nr:hypothetical protein [Gemmatimonadota bacterium]